MNTLQPYINITIYPCVCVCVYIYIYTHTHNIPLQLAHDLSFYQTYLMALVENLKEAQRAKGPTTILAIAIMNSENIV